MIALNFLYKFSHALAESIVPGMTHSTTNTESYNAHSCARYSITLLSNCSIGKILSNVLRAAEDVRNAPDELTHAVHRTAQFSGLHYGRPPYKYSVRQIGSYYRFIINAILGFRPRNCIHFHFPRIHYYSLLKIAFLFYLAVREEQIW